MNTAHPARFLAAGVLLLASALPVFGPGPVKAGPSAESTPFQQAGPDDLDREAGILRDQYGNVVQDTDGTRYVYRPTDEGFERVSLDPEGNELARLALAADPFGGPATPADAIAEPASEVATGAYPFEQTWMRGMWGRSIGVSNLPVEDLDGDGRPEIIAGASSATFAYTSTYWYVAAYRGGTEAYEQVWLSPQYSQAISRIVVANPDGTGKRIFVVASAGQLDVYSAWPVNLLTTVAVPANVTDLVAADVDGDGTQELVLSTQNALYVHDGASYARKWSFAVMGGADIDVGQLDSDAALEIVTATTPGRVVDGVTGVVEWTYDPGFGADVEVGNLDADPALEFVGAAGWGRVTAFDAEVRSPLWEISTPLDVGAMDLLDVEGDGQVEVLIGDGQWGAIKAYDGLTRQLKWSVSNPLHGVTEMNVGDVDGDGAVEVMWGAGATDTGQDNLIVANPGSQSIEWRSLDLVGPLAQVDAGDVDADGRMEVVMSSYESESGYDDGIIFVFDALTHAVEWQSDPVMGGYAWTGIHQLRLAQLDGDPQLEILIGTDRLYDGVIKAYDGLTHAVELQTDYTQYDGAPIYSLDIADADGDGDVDIVAGQGRAHTGAAGVYLLVLDPRSGAEIWRSVNLSGYWAPIYDVAVADLDGDPSQELVASVQGESVWVFDGVTKLLDWQSPMDAAAIDVFDADGDGNMELLVGTRGGLVDAYDGATHALEWSVILSGSVNAIRGLVTATGQRLILAAANDRLWQIDGVTREVRQASPVLAGSLGLGNHLPIADPDGDGRLQIWAGSNFALHELEQTDGVASLPDIAVSPDRLAADLTAGGSQPQTLTVRNTGTANLTFELVRRNTTPPAASAQALTFPAQKLETSLAEALDRSPDQPVEFLVYLKDQADLRGASAIPERAERGRFVVDRLRQVAQASQAGLLAFLNAQEKSGAVTAVRPYYIVNAVLVKGNRGVAQALAARPDVAYIESVKQYRLPEPIAGTASTTAGLEWGASKIGADRVWAEFGTRGEGVVVGSIDTGVLATHPALVQQYRGTATGSHNYNWYDPTGYYPNAPGDNQGHGTHTMGTLVGDDGAGNQIGVAPGAQWIAAKGCATNACSSAHLLAAAEWMLAPYPIGGTTADGDPSKRPDILNNSWSGYGGDLWFEGMVNAWRAADILPVFAAGNWGPDASTVGSPGDYAQSFASGATDSGDVIAYFSGRGPSALTTETKPDVTAPGVEVRSAGNDGGYSTWSGTSMASPHVAGCAALVKSLDPSVSLAEIEDRLASTAVDLGTAGPDFTHGFGRIDCRAAADLSNRVTWLSLDASTGTVPPGGERRITVTFSGNRAPGTYTADLVINNNDPDENPTIVPVTMTVANACHTLTLSASPGAGGSVSAQPAPNCNGGTQYTAGTVVQLTATANPGYLFDNWSGDAAGSTSPVSVAMDADKSVTANFWAPAQTLYLAEGYTGSGFGTFILLQNPNASPARVTLTYMLEGGGVETRSLLVPANARQTVAVQDASQLGPNQAFSTRLDADRPIVAERAMYWPNGGGTVAGHVAAAIAQPASTWYLAEGYTGSGFGTFILIQNPNPAAADVTVTYMLEGGGTVERNLSVPANARHTIAVQDPAQLGADKAFSTRLVSNLPVIVERAMYFPSEGHATGGLTAPAQTWYLAEGYTGGGANTFILLQNPSSNPANVTVRYMLQEGGVETRTVVVPGNARYTITVQDSAQLGPDQAFSTRLTSDQPIIVERAMYWPTAPDSVGGHASAGVRASNTTWYLAEGYTGAGFGTFILLQNPNSGVADVTLTYMLEGGGLQTRTVSVAGNSRSTVVAQEAGQLGADKAFSTRLEASRPIIVERSMYFANGGHNATGVTPP